MTNFEHYKEFHAATPDEIMDIVVDVFGRDAADRVVDEWAAIRKGSAKPPKVVWPRF